jgi:hypothetical protein
MPSLFGVLIFQHTRKYFTSFCVKSRRFGANVVFNVCANLAKNKYHANADSRHMPPFFNYFQNSVELARMLTRFREPIIWCQLGITPHIHPFFGVRKRAKNIPFARLRGNFKTRMVFILKIYLWPYMAIMKAGVKP